MTSILTILLIRFLQETLEITQYNDASRSTDQRYQNCALELIISLKIRVEFT
jgi:hypothetical protein